MPPHRARPPRRVARAESMKVSANGAFNAEVAAEDLWRSYELAVRHYETDLTLFINRTTIFLVIGTALVTIAGANLLANILNGDTFFLWIYYIAGAIVFVAWFATIYTSYVWLKAWRREMASMAGNLLDQTGVRSTALLFRSRLDFAGLHADAKQVIKMQHRAAWAIRPSFVLSILPLTFLALWVVLWLHAFLPALFVWM